MNFEVIYKGFSTHNYIERGGTFQLNGKDLVVMDILSHIYTRRRERVMMPTFGTIIPDAVFEGLTQQLIEQIRDDLEMVLDYEPRVERQSLTLIPFHDQNAIVANATIRFIEFNMSDTLEFVINIDNG